MTMLRSLASRHASKIVPLRPGLTSRRCLSNAPKHDPLRLLFCGADAFSIYSLRAVHELQKQEPDKIASIDVVCRPPKRTGRGLKNIQEVPIKAVAQDLHLPVHQIDTFTGWTPPSPIDLVIAVSFGLLVPSRILTAATYGGLNVHPSLLPDLRGPAPIQHALMKGRDLTGTSVQTMHPTRFDHGLVIDQAGHPIPDGSTTDQLIHILGPRGAQGLRGILSHGLFINPEPLGHIGHREPLVKTPFEHAPKIKPEDRRIDWRTWTGEKVDCYSRALGKLWDTTTYAQCTTKSGPPKRTVFEGPWRLLGDLSAKSTDTEQRSATHRPAVVLSREPSLDFRETSIKFANTVPWPAPGQPAVFREANKEWEFGVTTKDGAVAIPSAVTIEGGKQGMGANALMSMLWNQKTAESRSS